MSQLLFVFSGKIQNFTQSSFSFRIHFLRHLQSLCSCYVDITRNNHQADCFLFCNELPDQSLYLKYLFS